NGTITRRRQKERHTDLVHGQKGRIRAKFTHSPRNREQRDDVGNRGSQGKSAFSLATARITFCATSFRNGSSLRAKASFSSGWRRTIRRTQSSGASGSKENALAGRRRELS